MVNGLLQASQDCTTAVIRELRWTTQTTQCLFAVGPSGCDLHKSIQLTGFDSVVRDGQAVSMKVDGCFAASADRYLILYPDSVSSQ